MVAPPIAPLSSPLNFEYVTPWSDQLFVGSASAFVGVQIKVNCSTRATSFGFERCKYERGTFCSFSLISTLCFNDSAMRNSFSRSDPSHQSMFSGCVRAAASSTHSSTAWLRGLALQLPFGGNIAGAGFFIRNEDVHLNHESAFVEATA